MKTDNTNNRFPTVVIMAICGALIFAGMSMALLGSGFLSDMGGGFGGGSSGHNTGRGSVAGWLLFICFLMSLPAMWLGGGQGGMALIMTNSVIGALLFAGIARGWQNLMKGNNQRG